MSDRDPDPDGEGRRPPREPLTLVHHHPGRLRVRADVFRHDGEPGRGSPNPSGPSDPSGVAAFREGEAEDVDDTNPDREGPAAPGPSLVEKVRAALDAEPGIAAFVHNARTGSILIEYQPGLTDSETILTLIADAADLEMPSDEERPSKKPALVAIDAAKEVNELVADLTGQQTDLRSLVPLGLAALAAYSAVYGKEPVLPRWDNLLWWSYSIFSQLHRREIEGGRVAQNEP